MNDCGWPRGVLRCLLLLRSADGRCSVRPRFTGAAYCDTRRINLSGGPIVSRQPSYSWVLHVLVCNMESKFDIVTIASAVCLAAYVAIALVKFLSRLFTALNLLPSMATLAVERRLMALKAWGSGLRSEAGCAKPRWPSLASLPLFCTECGSKVPNLNGHHRGCRLACIKDKRVPADQRERTSPAGTLAFVRSPLALRCSKEQSALHTLIRQRHLTPSCGGHAPTAERTMDPARMCLESLDRRPGIREQPGSQPDVDFGLSNVRHALANGYPRTALTFCHPRRKGCWEGL